MEIILKEDIVGLGYKDDIVKVRAGFGRNYLIPQGKAIITNESSKKVLAENLKQRAHKLEKIKNDAKELAEKVKEIKVVIGAKTSSTGKIFGSVSNIQIADILKGEGIEIDRRLISIKEQIKVVGSYTALVKLHKEVTAELKFEVVSE